VVRGRATDARTGRRKDVWRVLTNSDKERSVPMASDLARAHPRERGHGRTVEKRPSRATPCRFNAARDVVPFDTARHRVYTREEPNLLAFAELRDFLACMHAKYPQYFAMTYTGFATGLRPSSLRPLRRKGATPDIDWRQGILLVRQSNARGDIVMESTKTAVDREIAVPKRVARRAPLARRHAASPGTARGVHLLFPSEIGGFRSRSCLDKPFANVAKAIDLKKQISPRAMRRTFQDLARAAEIRDVVTRSISGHATEEMQRRYSTVSPVEQQKSLARVLRLMDFRNAKRRPDSMVDSIRGEQGPQRRLPRTRHADLVWRCDRDTRLVPGLSRCGRGVLAHAIGRIDDEQATRDVRITNGSE
jgi:hypothetical protein